jgi:hypothetical protein
VDRSKAFVGANYSNVLGKWVGFIWDGSLMQTFDPRTTRERALQDGRDHMERIFNPEAPLEHWTP